MKHKLFYDYFHRDTKPLKLVIERNNFTYRNLLELLLKYSYLGKTFLDIGCGSGAISLFLTAQGKEVVGIDISKRAIESCIRSAGILKLEKRISFKTMKFPQETPRQKFDIIVCSEVLEHIKDDKRTLKKIYYLLQPSGLLVISVPSKNAPLYRLGFARKFDAKVGHLRRYGLEQLVNLCEKIGFNILETRKAEGILRNFLFLNSIAGKMIGFIKGPISDLVAALDNITLKLFGESQIFVVAQKK